MKIFHKTKQTSLLLLATLLTLTSTLSFVGHASAAVVNPAPAAQVSFTFDDSLASSITQAAPTLAKYGIVGTDYVITNCVGMVAIPNTCKANTDASYLTWDQVTALKNTYGWEIGSHTATHPYMASTDPQEQPAKLTPAQVVDELVTSKTTLASHGIDAKSYASPYGDYDATTLAQIAKYYETQRGFADLGYNTWPQSEYLLRVQQVQGKVSFATVKKYIDTAALNKQWLILVFHDIKTKASTKNDDYEYSTAKLDQIAAYVKSKNLATPTVGSAVVKGDTNLLPNGSFNSGLTNWTTDNASVFRADALTNGSFPDATNSVKITANTLPAHLFSAQVPVSFGSSYLLKNYSNVTKLTSGEVGYYIDEYDVNGNWISGQYKASQRKAYVDAINFSYSPTSAQVTKASLQIIVTANSGITGYFDNAQWYTLSSAVTPPPPTGTNLLTNGTFETGFNSWTTDSSSTIGLDSLNHGSPANPLNSVKLSSTTKDAHLFSAAVAVDTTKTYALNSYLNIKQRTSGEIGYYIDEYDANGNWISGQYKKSVSTTGPTSVNLSYTASSSAVKKISLQIIVTANSDIVAYFDNAELI